MTIRPKIIAFRNRVMTALRLESTLNKIRKRARQCVYWVEDHAELLTTVSVASWILGCGGVLIWEWALVISLAVQLAAILSIAVVSVSAALAILHWLQRRRDRRQLPPADASRQLPPAQAPLLPTPPVAQKDGDSSEKAGRDDPS